MLIEKTEEGLVKEAETADDRRRLTSEVEVLRNLLHPGVVAVTGCRSVEDMTVRVVFGLVTGPTLAEVGTQPVPALIGWAAAVATILADIHDLGFAHGDIRPEHVLLDDEGRPVLCGFGRAGRTDGVSQAEDVGALARLTLGLIPDTQPILKRRVDRRVSGWRVRRGGARTLARELVRLVPDAYVGPPEVAPVRGRTEAAEGTSPTMPGRSDGRPTPAGRSASRDRAIKAAGAVGALAGVLVIAWVLTGGAHKGPVRVPSGSYLLRTAPGESVLYVVGRWGCGAPRPALLDTTSGSVWVFHEWPAPRQRAPAVFLTTVAEATGLGIRRAGPRCDQLVVLRRNGFDVALTVEATG